ncbi:hypothetical protein ACJX0J_017597 [Zea mays]
MSLSLFAKSVGVDKIILDADNLEIDDVSVTHLDIGDNTDHLEADEIASFIDSGTWLDSNNLCHEELLGWDFDVDLNNGEQELGECCMEGRVVDLHSRVGKVGVAHG